MYTRNFFVVAAALLMAAGADVANTQSIGSSVAAADVYSSLRVYQLLIGPTWLYYQNRNRYRSLAYADHVKIFNKFTAVSFINTASQSIQQVTFELAAYSDGYRPVLDSNGQPLIKQLVATGPFAPGTKQTLVNANVVWSIPPGNGLGCVRLNGMQIVYADGSSTSVTASDVSRYLAPSLSNTCGVPPRNHVGVHSLWVGPSPYIVGVYPARWMVLHEYEKLYRQPYIPPSDMQPLCAVGSLVEETCGAAVTTSDSESAY
ncbi:MAG: hypothetical protein ACRESE_07580 [Gammaproteobacteria bacterium]